MTEPDQSPKHASNESTAASTNAPNNPTNNAPNKTPNKTQQAPRTDVSLVCDSKSQSHGVLGKTKKPKKGRPIIMVLALMGLFLALMVYRTVFGTLERPAGEMVVEEGQSYFGLLPEFQAGVPMFSNTLAKLYIKATVDTPLQAGTYAMPDNPSLHSMLDVLTAPPVVKQIDVQIIEGKTAKTLYQTLANTEGVVLEVLNKDGTPKGDMKDLLGIDAFTPAGAFAENLEGWFTPDTYHYNEGVSDKQILQDLYARQQGILDEAWANRANDLPYDTPYDALIMASIIEKETSVPEERAKVSAVFVNRLRQGMRLQTDPTIIYGMGERYDGDIKRKDIQEKTAYNTYQIDGLPPTPIALPSQASIEASLNPADFDALYFVATGHGGHKFSKTLAEHNRAVQDYLKVIRAKK